MSDGDRLYAEDIAEMLGVTVRAAQRHLAALERKHGPEIVGTMPRTVGGKPRRFTTRAALAKISPAAGRVATGVERRLDDLEAMVASLRREMDEMRRVATRGDTANRQCG